MGYGVALHGSSYVFCQGRLAVLRNENAWFNHLMIYTLSLVEGMVKMSVPKHLPNAMLLRHCNALCIFMLLVAAPHCQKISPHGCCPNIEVVAPPSTLIWLREWRDGGLCLVRVVVLSISIVWEDALLLCGTFPTQAIIPRLKNASF
jgi:hypothetical protein